MEINIPDSYFDEESLKNTPKRIEKFIKEWKNNQNFNFTTFPNPNYDQMIVLKDIDFYSLCEHHLLPFYGRIHIGYIPNERICGISKLARVVDMFASRPQLQERLTQQIANYIEKELEPKGVMVVVEGIHLCMRMRGVKKPNSVMITSALKGVFGKLKVREEFLNFINSK